MIMQKSSLNEAIYKIIDLKDNASVADLGCRNAGYLNGLIQEFPNKITKAVGIDVTDKNFNTILIAVLWSSELWIVIKI